MIQKPIITALILSSLSLCVHLTNLKANLANEKLTSHNKWLFEGFTFSLFDDPETEIVKTESWAIWQYSITPDRFAPAFTWTGSKIALAKYNHPNSDFNFMYLNNGKTQIIQGGRNYIARSPDESKKEITSPDCNKRTECAQITIEKNNLCYKFKSYKGDYIKRSGNDLIWASSGTCFSLFPHAIDKHCGVSVLGDYGKVIQSKTCTRTYLPDFKPAEPCVLAFKIDPDDQDKVKKAKNTSKDNCGCSLTLTREQVPRFYGGLGTFERGGSWPNQLGGKVQEVVGKCYT